MTKKILSVAAALVMSAAVFGQTGKVGIGTTNPQAKLHVEGNVKIVDGTQGMDKVLTSDSNGLARWNSAPITQVFSQRSPTIMSINGIADGQAKFFYTGNTITLPEGDWLIFGGETPIVKNTSGSNVSGAYNASFYLTSTPGSAGLVSQPPANFISSSVPFTNINEIAYYGYVTNWPNGWGAYLMLWNNGTMFVSLPTQTTLYIVGYESIAWASASYNFTVLNGTDGRSGWRAIKLK